MIDLLFGSRILISPQAFQVERQAIGKEEDPSRPSPGFQTGPIAEVLAGSTHVTQLVPANPAKPPKKKKPANEKTRKPKKALKITPAKKTRPSPVKIKSVKG